MDMMTVCVRRVMIDVGLTQKVCQRSDIRRILDEMRCNQYLNTNRKSELDESTKLNKTSNEVIQSIFT